MFFFLHQAINCSTLRKSETRLEEFILKIFSWGIVLRISSDLELSLKMEKKRLAFASRLSFRMAGSTITAEPISDSSISNVFVVSGTRLPAKIFRMRDN